MTLTEFKESLLNDNPPANASVYLKALWYDAQGDWDKAHELIQDVSGQQASLIHAYLHRKEGDLWNAEYWYNRCWSIIPDVSLNEEWEQIASSLL